MRPNAVYIDGKRIAYQVIGKGVYRAYVCKQLVAECEVSKDCAKVEMRLIDQSFAGKGVEAALAKFIARHRNIKLDKPNLKQMRESVA